MIEEELERFRLKLLGLEEEISDYLSKSEESAAAVEPDKSLGRLSRMEAMQDQQMVLELQKEEKAKTRGCKCIGKNRKRYLRKMFLLWQRDCL